MKLEERSMGETEGTVEPARHLGSFSTTSKEVLLKEGYLIYPLSGKSIRTLKAEGTGFWSIWHKKRPQIEEIRSSIGEIAINPKEVFIPGSNLKSLGEQSELATELSAQLASEDGGVQAVEGNVADFSELFFLHMKKTGEDLFNGKYARTTDSAFSSPIYVGGAIDGKLGIVYWQFAFGDCDYYTARVIAPRSKAA